MITKHLVLAGCLIGIISSTLTAQASTSERARLAEELMRANALERPAKAAALVAEADNPQKAEVALALASTVQKNSPASLAQVVSAMVATAPNAATEIIVGIAREFPHRASEIGIVATKAAPKHLGSIVGSVAYHSPKATPEITHRLASAFPERRALVVAAALDGLQKNANPETYTASFAMSPGHAGPGVQSQNGSGNSGSSSDGVPDPILSQLERTESDLDFSAQASKGEKTSFAAQLLQAKKTQSRTALLNKLKADLARDTDLSAQEIDSIVQAVEDESSLEDARELTIEAKINYASP